jgi:AcrR family transcriptional regulator
MTEKKEKILHAALQLFARDGFKGTATSKVAEHAGVSEGLIFRHFSSKEGLLEAVLEDGAQRAKHLFAEIVNAAHPKEVIEKTIDVAQKLSEDHSEGEFWKLQYKIKWELEIDGSHKLQDVESSLVHAFSALGYEQPQLEAEHLLMYLDGLATQFFLKTDYDPKPMINLIKAKYHV